MIIVVMGVAGSGKTTIGRKLAEALGYGFSDADSFHSAANIAKMRAGIPLTDEDREPWLRSMRAAIEDWRREGTGHVLACSTLKARYRRILADDDPDVRFLYLKGGPGLIAERLKGRTDHFFDPKLLESQFATLEEPAESEAIVVSVEGTPEDIVRKVVRTIRNEEGSPG